MPASSYKSSFSTLLHEGHCTLVEFGLVTMHDSVAAPRRGRVRPTSGVDPLTGEPAPLVPLAFSLNPGNLDREALAVVDSCLGVSVPVWFENPPTGGDDLTP